MSKWFKFDHAQTRFGIGNETHKILLDLGTNRSFNPGQKTSANLINKKEKEVIT